MAAKGFEDDYKQIKFNFKKDEYSFGTMVTFLEWLHEIEASIPKEALKVYWDIGIDTCDGYYDSIEKEFYVRGYYWIPYTDEEKAEKKAIAAAISKGKLEAAKKRKQEKEEKDRQEYERLRKKYEATSCS